MNNQKGLASIITVLILIAIVGVGILAWQYFGTPEEEVREETEPPKEEVKISETKPSEVKTEVKTPEEVPPEEISSKDETANILLSLPFYNNTKLLRVYGAPVREIWNNNLRLVVYDTKDKTSVYLGNIRPVSYTGNSGGLFVPFAITKDNNNIILNAEMGDPGAGGGDVNYGYAMIPIKPAPGPNWVIKDFFFIATRSAHFYDSFSKVVYVDEGEKTPHYSMPGPSNNGSIVFRNLNMESNKDFYATAYTGYKRSGFKTPNDVMAGGAEKILEEGNTSYKIIGLDENNKILRVKATVYSFSDNCPREEDALYCAEKSTVERSIPLP